MALLLLPFLAVAASQPPPPSGQWSGAHLGTWCDKGKLVEDLGKQVSLTNCKSFCERNSSCSFVSHADSTDHRCIAYGDCPDPMCDAARGWFSTYQFGRPGGPPWKQSCTPAPAPAPPAPAPPAPPPAGAMTVVVVSTEIATSHGAKCLDGSPPVRAL